MRLPSDETVGAVESLLLRWVSPAIGLGLIVLLVVTDSRNPLTFGAAGSLVLTRPVSKRRSVDDTDPGEASGS